MSARFRMLWLLGLSLVLAQAATLDLLARQETALATLYQDAMGKFVERQYESAAPLLSQIIETLRPMDLNDPARRQLLINSYSLRAQTSFGQNLKDMAEKDLRSLFALDPARTNHESTNPGYILLFESIRKTMVGALSLVGIPAGAEVFIDNKRVSVTQDMPIPLAARDYEVRISKPSYEDLKQIVTISPGDPLPLPVDLKRISSTIHLVTVPPDVEVTLNQQVVGRTPPGPAPKEFADGLEKLRKQLADASGVLPMANLTTGKYTLGFRKDCYKPATLPVTLLQPDDYTYGPILLDRASGLLHVTAAANQRVFLNGVLRPTGAPDDACEGHYDVDVRSDYGRYLDSVEIAAGDEKTVTARVKPAVAMLAFTGIAESVRGASDPRPRLTRELLKLDVMLFPPPDAELTAAMTKAKVVPGWLAFDTAGRTRTIEAENFRASGRSEASAMLAKSLTAQAVAEVAVLPESSDDSQPELLVTMLAAGAGRPDTFSIHLGDTASVDEAISRLTQRPLLVSRSTEIQVADVRDLPGPVVVMVRGAAAAAGIARGDTVAKVNDKPISDSVAFQAAIDAAGAAITVEFRDRNEAIKTAKLTVTQQIAVIGLDDRTLLPNKLILDFRRQLIESPNAADEPMLRLNLAVALMQVEAWTDARTELQKVRLGEGGDVSAGTVQYLLGLCHKYIGDTVEANSAFQIAARATTARLTVDGPLISLLAQAELAGKGRKNR